MNLQRATENVEVIENNNDNNTEPDAKSATTGNKQEDTIVEETNDSTIQHDVDDTTADETNNTEVLERMRKPNLKPSHLSCFLKKISLIYLHVCLFYIFLSPFLYFPIFYFLYFM